LKPGCSTVIPPSRKKQVSVRLVLNSFVVLR
jgi:hypothetical protein